MSEMTRDFVKRAGHGGIDLASALESGTLGELALGGTRLSDKEAFCLVQLSVSASLIRPQQG